MDSERERTRSPRGPVTSIGDASSLGPVERRSIERAGGVVASGGVGAPEVFRDLLHERNKDGMDGKIVVDVVERRGEDHHAAFALGMDNEEWRSVIETQENGRGTRSYGRSAKEANTIPAGSRAQDRVCGVDLRDRGKAGVARCSAGVMPEQKKCASAALHVLIYGGFEAGGS